MTAPAPDHLDLDRENAGQHDETSDAVNACVRRRSGGNPVLKLMAYPVTTLKGQSGPWLTTDPDIPDRSLILETPTTVGSGT